MKRMHAEIKQYFERRIYSKQYTRKGFYESFTANILQKIAQYPVNYAFFFL